MKLKPCPFCGGEAKLYTIFKDIDFIVDTHSVLCEECESESMRSEDKEEVIKSWNTRSIEIDREKLIEIITKCNITSEAIKGYRVETSNEDKIQHWLECDREELCDAIIQHQTEILKEGI